MISDFFKLMVVSLKEILLVFDIIVCNLNEYDKEIMKVLDYFVGNVFGIFVKELGKCILKGVLE